MTIFAWLATYLVHSTILLLGALIVTRFMTNERAREVLWKTALVGGFITSIIPSIAGVSPLSKTWNVLPQTEQASLPAAIQSTAPVNRPAAPITSTNNTPPSSASEPAFVVRPAWTQVIIAVWILIGLLLIARLVSHQRRIMRALRDRRAVSDGALPGMLAELRRKAAVWTPVRLTASHACPTPIALGRSEICIPERFENDLEVEQQRTALAHELAHLKRHDPVWQMGAGVIESVFFFQPLNVVARRKLRDAAEFLADDWAVQQTKEPLALARCLTQISSWVGTAPVPDGMLAMAEGGSPLVNRIERLAEWQRSSSVPARVAVAAALAFLALVASSAPIFSAVPTPHSDIIASLAPVQEMQGTSPDSILKYAGPTGALAERFQWAMSQNVNRPHWIGWRAKAAPMGGSFTASSSTMHMMFGVADAPTFASLVRDDAPASDAAILVRFGAGRAKESEVDAVAFMPMTYNVWLGRDPIVWLGAADVGESLSLLDKLRTSSRNPGIRSELAAAYAIHGDANRVIPGTREMLNSEGSSDVRTEAIQWIARMHGDDPRAVDLLHEATMRGRDHEMRMEAVDGLRHVMSHGSMRAHDALMDVADHAKDMGVRSEAMQALVKHSK